MSPNRSATVRQLHGAAADVDLAAFAGADGVLFERAGVGFAGRGIAAAIDVDDRVDAAAAVAAWFAGVTVDGDPTGDRPGVGPLACAALPFDPAAPVRLVIPREVVARADDGTVWRTTIHGDDRAEAAAVPGPSSEPAAADEAIRAVDATDYAVRATRPVDEWCTAVADARDVLRRTDVRKVVLARELEVRADRPIDTQAAILRLRRAYRGCHVTAMPGPGGSRMIGASPELLVARTGTKVRSHPMAGTAPATGDARADAALAADLLASLKDQMEHRITIDRVHEALLPWCSYLDEEAEPSIVAVANVQHLATEVEGRLSSPPASVLDLVVALHPTPAVCGHPRDDALALIERFEGIDRQRYAGPVGWVDAAGNGTWAVGIRCAEVHERHARVFAGVGVVADSDPEAELAETQAKFQAVLGALVRP